jgi:hypothetical protein
MSDAITNPDTAGNQAILTRMRTALDAFVAGGLDTQQFINAWHEEAEALVLPPPYGVAMDDLLRRLQMSAAFVQDSCSFTGRAVTDQLAVWLRKASQVQ